MAVDKAKANSMPAENIKRALEAELGFYGRIFGFSPHGIAEIVKIDNLA